MESGEAGMQSGEALYGERRSMIRGPEKQDMEKEEAGYGERSSRI